MSISNEALHKVGSILLGLRIRSGLICMLPQLAREIETQAALAQQQIGLARTQIGAKQREQRLVKLTVSELDTLPDDAVVYEGVGKM